MIQQSPDSDRFRTDIADSSVTAEDNTAESLNQSDDVEAADLLSESNRDDENPDNLPWPEENESKE